MKGEQAKLTGQIKRIQEDTLILPENKKDILSFLESSQAKGVTMGRALFLAQKLKVIGHHINKPFKSADKDDVAGCINAINNTGRYSESSREQFKRVIKLFYRHLFNLTSKDALPDAVKWLPCKAFSNNLLPHQTY